MSICPQKGYKGVAFVGTMGSGKTTTATIFRDVFNARVLSFATKLKELATTLYGMTSKNRSLLQGLGAAMRMIHPDVFVNCLAKELESNSLESPWQFLVVDDVRYVNEFEFLQKEGFYMVHIERCIMMEKEDDATSNPQHNNHESEINVKHLASRCDVRLDNSAMSEEDLRKWVLEFAKDNMMLEQRLGYQFENRDLLVRALTHGSYPGSSIKTNFQPLETLGDSVLNLVVTDTDFHMNTEATPGSLTSHRKSITSNSHLSKCAESLGLCNEVLAIDSVKKDPQAMARIAADSLEAIIGAVWLDCNDFEIVRKFTNRILKYETMLNVLQD